MHQQSARATQRRYRRIAQRGTHTNKHSAHRTADAAAIAAANTAMSRGHAIAASIVVTAATYQCIVVICMNATPMPRRLCISSPRCSSDGVEHCGRPRDAWRKRKTVERWTTMYESLDSENCSRESGTEESFLKPKVCDLHVWCAAGMHGTRKLQSTCCYQSGVHHAVVERWTTMHDRIYRERTLRHAWHAQRKGAFVTAMRLRASDALQARPPRLRRRTRP
jgi:hypothetical protein